MIVSPIIINIYYEYSLEVTTLKFWENKTMSTTSECLSVKEDTIGGGIKIAAGIGTGILAAIGLFQIMREIGKHEAKRRIDKAELNPYCGLGKKVHKMSTKNAKRIVKGRLEDYVTQEDADTFIRDLDERVTKLSDVILEGADLEDVGKLIDKLKINNTPEPVQFEPYHRYEDKGKRREVPVVIPKDDEEDDD